MGTLALLPLSHVAWDKLTSTALGFLTFRRAEINPPSLQGTAGIKQANLENEGEGIIRNSPRRDMVTD